MTRPSGYSHTGIFLSDLAAAGRTSVTVACERCDHARTFAFPDLIAQVGDIVMPDALGAVTADCPKRSEVASFARCEAVYRDPATPAEMERIRAARPEEPVREARHRRRW